MVSRINRSAIIYVSYSGNTEEMAAYLKEYIEDCGIEVDLFDVTNRLFSIDLTNYDLVFLGAFTWDYGSVPEEMEDFLSRTNLQIKELAIFGSGDTQFGGEALYCRALNILKERYGSPWEVLKVEQSPRGYQEERVYEWVREVVKDVYKVEKSKDLRTALSE